MNNIAIAMHSDLAVRESRLTKTKKAQTVQDKYGDRASDMLLLLTRAEDDDDLPEYHLTITAKTKGLSERVIFQREVDAAAAEALGFVQYQVMPSQVMTMKSLSSVAHLIEKYE
jgi:hypothetical protein